MLTGACTVLCVVLLYQAAFRHGIFEVSTRSSALKMIHCPYIGMRQLTLLDVITTSSELTVPMQ